MKSLVVSLLVVALLGASLASQSQAQDHDYEHEDQVNQYQLQDDQVNDNHSDTFDDEISENSNHHELHAQEVEPRRFGGRFWKSMKKDRKKIAKYGALGLAYHFLRTGEVEILGHHCRYVQDTFQGYYRGLVSCPGWTSITGQAVIQDSSMVREATVENFLKMAVKNGIITEQDVSNFLQSTTIQP